jgi:hypothetical protein
VQRDETSVVIAPLKKIDSPARNLVDQPMLLRDSPRPRSAQLMLEWLGFADAMERISQDILNQ